MPWLRRMRAKSPN